MNSLSFENPHFAVLGAVLPVEELEKVIDTAERRLLDGLDEVTIADVYAHRFIAGMQEVASDRLALAEITGSPVVAEPVGTIMLESLKRLVLTRHSYEDANFGNFESEVLVQQAGFEKGSRLLEQAYLQHTD